MADIPRHVRRHPTLEALAAANVTQVQQLHHSGAAPVDPETLWSEPESTIFNHIVTVRQPGARPRSSWLDMLLCYLAWLKLGVDYAVLSCVLGDISASRLEDNIIRIRPHLRSALNEKWLRLPSRPVPSECYRPKASFEEAKIYFDAKNKVYGLKTEVAVSAHEPHFCVFVGSHTPGSVHDFEIMKRDYQKYLEYLLKLPNENASLPADQHSRF